MYIERVIARFGLIAIAMASQDPRRRCSEKMSPLAHGTNQQYHRSHKSEASGVVQVDACPTSTKSCRTDLTAELARLRTERESYCVR